MGVKLKTHHKAKLLSLLLFILILWPPCHYILVQRFRLNPWSFAGWAMYCMPNPSIGVEVLAGVKRQRINQSPELTAKILSYAKSRKNLGNLSVPDDLAESVRQEHDLAVVIIRVDEVGLNVASSRIEKLSYIEYEYHRQKNEMILKRVTNIIGK